MFNDDDFEIQTFIQIEISKKLNRFVRSTGGKNPHEMGTSS